MDPKFVSMIIQYCLMLQTNFISSCFMPFLINHHIQSRCATRILDLNSFGPIFFPKVCMLYLQKHSISYQ